MTTTGVGSVTNNGNTYTVYNSDTGLAQVLVANAITHAVSSANIEPTLTTPTPVSYVDTTADVLA